MVRQGDHGTLCHDLTAAAAAAVFAARTLSQNGIVYGQEKGSANLALGKIERAALSRVPHPCPYASRCLVRRSDMFKSSSQSLSVEARKQIDDLNCDIGNQTVRCGGHASVQVVNLF